MSQTKQSEYHSELKAVREQLAAATTELSAKCAKKGPRQCTTTTLEYDDLIRVIGKKISVMDELWLSPDVFDLPKSSIPDPTSPERFANDDAYNHGTAVALYRAVPEKHHDDMANLTEFRRAVLVILLFFVLHF